MPLPPPKSVSSTSPTTLAEQREFAQRNANRVTSLGCFAPNFAEIRMFSQLRHLSLDLEKEATVALLPRSLTYLSVTLRSMCINWEHYRSLSCLQVLQIHSMDFSSYKTVQLDDSFATALPLLRVFRVDLGCGSRHGKALETTATVVMPHLLGLTFSQMNIVHLDLHFRSALKSLTLVECTVSAVSAACSTLALYCCRMREGTVLVTPNLRSLFIYGGGLHKLDGSKCRHALSIVYKNKSSLEWVGAKPNVENPWEDV